MGDQLLTNSETGKGRRCETNVRELTNSEAGKERRDGHSLDQQ